MCKATENAHKTAITRKNLSSPARYLTENDLLKGKCLDFGCGKGFDCDSLNIEGFDPHYRNEADLLVPFSYDTIMCNFVLNVLQGESRKDVLAMIKAMLTEDGVAYVSVRNDKSALKGFTSKGTYQTFVELDYPIVKKTGSFVMYKVEK